MTLRDFIQTEIEKGNAFDVEEFGRKIEHLQYEDGDLIKPIEFKDYLDHELDTATVHYYFGRLADWSSYEISVKYKDFSEDELA